MSLGDRTASVTDRIARTLERSGLSAPVIRSIRDTLHRTFEERADPDPHHYATLHPARNALILMHDVAVTDAVELRSAIRLDSLRPPLPALGDEGVDALVAQVPRPGGDEDRLLEDLVGAPAAARRIALADFLDHARHLHLMNVAFWNDMHRRALEVYLPVAGRTDAVLARRLQRWCEMFDRRWLPGARP